MKNTDSDLNYKQVHVASTIKSNETQFYVGESKNIHVLTTTRQTMQLTERKIIFRILK